NWLQTMMEMTYYFRLNDEEWKDKLFDMYTGLEQMLLTQADIANFVNNLIHQLQKEIHTLSPEMYELWRGEYAEQFQKIATDTETLTELSENVLPLMTKLAGEIETERKSRNNHSI